MEFLPIFLNVRGQPSLVVGGRDTPKIYEPGGINYRGCFNFGKFREKWLLYPSTEAKPCLMAYWIRAERLLSSSFDIMLYL